MIIKRSWVILPVLASAAFLAACSGSSPQLGPGKATETPASVFVADLRSAGMTNPPTASAVDANKALICQTFTSGVPLEGTTQGIPTSKYVDALNDSKLCGASPITIPPTSWSTP